MAPSEGKSKKQNTQKEKKREKKKKSDISILLNSDAFLRFIQGDAASTEVHFLVVQLRQGAAFGLGMVRNAQHRACKWAMQQTQNTWQRRGNVLQMTHMGACRWEMEEMLLSWVGSWGTVQWGMLWGAKFGWGLWG